MTASMDTPDLPLFRWEPPACRMIPFPLINQVGKIRDTARKLSEKASEKHSAYYRQQVTEGLEKKLSKLGITQSDQAAMITAFWQSVELEMARLTYRGSKPGGAA